MKNNKTLVLIALGCAILVLLLCCLATIVFGFLYYRGESNLSTVSDEITVTSAETVTVTTSSPTSTTTTTGIYPKPSTGTIKGRIGYPSEILPPQKVCGEHTITGNTYCTEKITTTNYSLMLKPGTYHIYAEIVQSGDMSGEKAYYTDFVECGLKAGCPSHEKITVTVEAGEILNGIDPIDWYDY